MESVNPFALNSQGADKIAGIDYLHTDGNVNIGKDKGHGQLLITRANLFVFRTEMNSAMVGGVAGGLVGALIGYFIDKQRAKKRAPPVHLDDPEVHALGDKVTKKIATARMLAKVPLNSNLKIERTRLGFQFTPAGETPIIYQGLMHKNKIIAFLAMSGFDVR